MIRRRVVEARRAKPKYFPGKHVLRGSLSAITGNLWDRAYEIVRKKAEKIVNDIFKANVEREYDGEYNANTTYEADAVIDWHDKYVEKIADKIIDDINDLEILVPDRRVKSKDFNALERDAKEYTGADARVWWGVLDSVKAASDAYDFEEWDEDGDLWAEADTALNEVLLSLPREEKKIYKYAQFPED